ncbi:MAG: hypothetical protein AAF483_30970 [Planctomycetota bacterium]
MDGATTGFGGTTNPFTTISGGVGGVSGHFVQTIDVAGLGIAGVSEVNDLSVLVIGFGKQEDGLAGTTFVDNLSLTASIPEPSSLSLASLLGLVFCARRRNRN